MSWVGRLTALAILVALLVGVGFVAREVGGDPRVIETVTTSADGETVTVREGGRDFPGFLFLPFAFFGAIFFWFVAFGLLKAVMFGFWSRGGGSGGGGGPRGWRGRRWDRWEAHARELHEEWHASGSSTRTDPSGLGGERPAQG